jgi:wobble nucleotide-excising tRNase
MPSVSKKQQRLMGMAYAYEKGDIPNVSNTVKDLAKSFIKGEKKGTKKYKRNLKKLRDFAATKHDNLKENKIQRFNQFYV